jgi:hypothetical protein
MASLNGNRQCHWHAHTWHRGQGHSNGISKMSHANITDHNNLPIVIFVSMLWRSGKALCSDIAHTSACMRAQFDVKGSTRESSRRLGWCAKDEDEVCDEIITCTQHQLRIPQSSQGPNKTISITLPPGNANQALATNLYRAHHKQPNRH